MSIPFVISDLKEIFDHVVRRNMVLGMVFMNTVLAHLESLESEDGKGARYNFELVNTIPEELAEQVFGVDMLYLKIRLINQETKAEKLRVLYAVDFVELLVTDHSKHIKTYH